MGSHPKCGMAQGTILVRNWKDGPEWLLDGCGGMLTPFGTLTTPGWLEPPSAPVAGAARRCFSPSGAMLLLRRAAIEDVGRLFYDFFHTYYEEVDFCHRAWLAGWEVWYVPTPLIDHAHGATMSRFYTREDILRKFYRNIRFSFRTCFGVRGRWTVVPVFELACFAQSVLQLVRGKGVAWRAHRWAKRELRAMKKEIAEARAVVQSGRTMSDTGLFRKVMIHLSLRDLVAMARGNL